MIPLSVVIVEQQREEAEEWTIAHCALWADGQTENGHSVKKGYRLARGGLVRKSISSPVL
jgi:hypothetical protein